MTSFTLKENGRQHKEATRRVFFKNKKNYFNIFLLKKNLNQNLKHTLKCDFGKKHHEQCNVNLIM